MMLDLPATGHAFAARRDVFIAGASLSFDAFPERLCHHGRCLRVKFVICSSAGSPNTGDRPM